MKISKIGSQVKLQETKFRARKGDCFFAQVFKVVDASKLSGWKTHSLCTNMFAMSSKKLGLFW